MSCQKCGACCRHSILEIEHLDIVREPKLLAVAILLDGRGKIKYESDWEKQYALPSPCPMLTGNECSIYPTRPNICVAFDPDGDERDKHLAFRRSMAIRSQNTAAV